MQFAALFQDSAVLQREISIPVWGKSAPNERVTVTLAGLTAAADSGPDGQWLVRFPPLSAGGPHELVASAPSGQAVRRDILVGEVWVCSGQSNMEWRLFETDQSSDLVPAEVTDGMRLLTVANPARFGSHSHIEGQWQVASEQSLNEFSAVAGWFGRELRKELGVPVGLICNAWGGTRIQAWMSRGALMEEPEGIEDLRTCDATHYLPTETSDAFYQDFEDWGRRGAPQDAGNAGLEHGWEKPDFDDSLWQEMELPCRWQDHGHPGSGVFWFRRTVVVPTAWTGGDLELHLGAVDKHDDTWVNGEHVGGISWEAGADSWRILRVYNVPGRLVGADGRVCVAVRARSHVYHGGLTGPVGEMWLSPAQDSQPIRLAGTWRYAVEQDWGLVALPMGDLMGNLANAPSILFDSRVTPLLPYAIRGVIWYQGESNAAEAPLYRRLLPALVRDWRSTWGQGNFPFLQVQLANFMPVADEPGPSQWAELREAQLAALSDPEVGMAVAIDVGDADDIHPRDKRTVGIRLARWALARTYGWGGLPSGPLFKHAEFLPDGCARIDFEFSEGLRTREGKAPARVAIAGADRKFVWADARIVAETLMVRSEQVPEPVAVRYAWADNPDGCNLENAAGLPASPFRTDSW